MGKHAHFTIAQDEPDKPLILIDVGPWDTYLSITNDAENVVARMVSAGRLPEGRRLLYHDTEGVLTELFVKDGKFAGFGGP